VIASFLLAAALAVSPAPAPAATPSAARNPRLDVTISLNLKDAAVVDLLEKMADLLGVTPILDPAVGGTVSLDVDGLTVSSALAQIEDQAGIEIVVSGDVLRAKARRGESARGAAPSSSLPTAPVPGQVLRVWLEGAEERAMMVRVPSWVGRLDLPGCAEPVTIAPLGPYGGNPWAVAISSRDESKDRPSARILDTSLPGAQKALLPGCDARLVVEVRAAGKTDALLVPSRVDKGQPLVASMRLLEVTGEREELLAEPRVAFQADSGFSVRSGWTAGAAGSGGQEIEIHGAPLDIGSDDSATLAIFARITRTRAAAEGVAVQIARARRAESFWLRHGRLVRWTVDSSWEGGRAALVLEITLDRMAATSR
jgi:hypothetical protein